MGNLTRAVDVIKSVKDGVLDIGTLVAAFDAACEEERRKKVYGVWIVKVDGQYLAWCKGRSAGCEFKQRKAKRFTSVHQAYRVAARTFGLAALDDDGYGAKVVRLVPRATRTSGVAGEESNG